MPKPRWVLRGSNPAGYASTLFAVALVGVLDGLLMAGCSWARNTPVAAQHTASAPAKTASPAQLAQPVPTQPVIDIKEPVGLARVHWPLSAGVPFPPGVVKETTQLSLREADSLVSVQSRVLGRWPDGSVRWALLDWQTDLKAHQQRHFRVEQGSPTAPAKAVNVAEQSDRIGIDTGPLQFAVPKNQAALLVDVRLNGKPVISGPVVSFFSIEGRRIEAQAPTSVTVTDRGPLRVRIEARGHYASGFDYVVRIDAFANQPFVRVLHTFEQRSAEAYVLVRQIGVDLPMMMKGKIGYSAGIEQGPPLVGVLPAKGFTFFQEDNEILHTGDTQRSGRGAGWVDLHDVTHGVAIASRFFWQEYPQSFQLRSTGITLNLWAPEGPPAKIGMGAAKTHEWMFVFHDATPPAASTLAALTQPLVARVDPYWIAASGALRNSLAPVSSVSGFLRDLAAGYKRYQAHADTERWDDSGQVRCAAPKPSDAAAERPRRGFYGMFNWGDWNFPGYHDTTKGCDAWGNLEYDMTQVLALAYAATGERSYFDGMVAAARHFMDVDTIYHQRARPIWVGMNHPKNPLHFTFEMGGVDLGHTWTEGLLSYYALSGDERGLDAARGIADYLVRRLHAGVVVGNPRQWGWPQIALVAAYETTGDPRYREAALEYARNGMAIHAPTKVGDFKMGVLAEALAYTHSVTQDAPIKHWLGRYADAVIARSTTPDARMFPAIAYLGRVTGQERYQRAAAATVPRLKFGNWGKPLTIASRLGFSILAAGAPAPNKDGRASPTGTEPRSSRARGGID